MLRYRNALLASVYLFFFDNTLVSPSYALNLNDRAAKYYGGIKNYWDYNNKYSSVAHIYIDMGKKGGATCSGTLIDSRTVLTAAHCLSEANPQKSHVSVRFTPDARHGDLNDREASSFLIHHGYDNDIHFSDNDIALIALKSPITSLDPVGYYRVDVPYGKPLTFVGYGRSGTGSDPSTFSDNKRRVGKTILSSFNKNDYECETGCLYSYFINPAAGFNDRPFLEAQTDSGDSGGPLFTYDLLGVPSLVAITRGGVSSGYGALMVWTPLFPYAQWIEENSSLRKTTSLFGSHNWSDEKAWSDKQGHNDVPDNNSFASIIYGIEKPYHKVNTDPSDNPYKTKSIENSYGDNDIYYVNNKQYYYDVVISDGSSIKLDKNVEVDRLRINGESASLDILSVYTLSALAGVEVNGKLRVDGTIITPHLALNAGMIDGTGLITSDLLLNNDVIIPGRVGNAGDVTPGVLTIQGAYVQLEGATLISALGRDGAGKINVEGEALVSGRLHITGEPGRYNPGQLYTALSTTGGVYERFDVVTSDMVFLDPVVTYSQTDVRFQLVRNQRPFASFAYDLNSIAAANAFETVSIDNHAYQDLVKTNVNSQSLQSAFSLLSGEVHASTVSVVYGDAGVVRDTVLQRLRMASTKNDLLKGDQIIAADAGNVLLSHLTTGATRIQNDLDPDRFAVWGTGLGVWVQWRGNIRNSALKTSGGGFLVGAEVKPDDLLRLGLAGGYINTNLDIHNQLSWGSNSSFFGSLYGNAALGDWQIRLGAAYMHNDIKTQRSVILSTFSDALSSSRDSNVWQAFGDIGYEFKLPNGVRVEPFVSGSVFRMNAGRFAEFGLDAALTGFARHYDIATTMFAIRGEVPLHNDMPLTVRGLIGWRIAFGDIHPAARVAFTQGSDAFFVNGAPVDRNELVVDAGLDWQIQKDISVGVNAGGQFGTNTHSQHLKGNFVWKF